MHGQSVKWKDAEMALKYILYIYILCWPLTMKKRINCLGKTAYQLLNFYKIIATACYTYFRIKMAISCCPSRFIMPSAPSIANMIIFLGSTTFRIENNVDIIIMITVFIYETMSEHSNTHQSCILFQQLARIAIIRCKGHNSLFHLVKFQL